MEWKRLWSNHRYLIISLGLVVVVTVSVFSVILDQQQSELNSQKQSQADDFTSDLKVELRLVRDSFTHLIDQMDQIIPHFGLMITQHEFEQLVQYDSFPFRDFVQNLRFSPVVCHGQVENYTEFAVRELSPDYRLRPVPESALDDYFRNRPFYIPITHIVPIDLAANNDFYGLDLYNISGIVNTFFHRFTRVDRTINSDGLEFFNSRDLEDLGMYIGRMVTTDCPVVEADSFEELMSANQESRCVIGFTYIPFLARDYIEAALSLFAAGQTRELIADLEYVIWDRRSDSVIYRPESRPHLTSEAEIVESTEFVTSTELFDQIELYLLFGRSLRDRVTEDRIQLLWIMTPVSFTVVIVMITTIYILIKRSQSHLIRRNRDYTGIITYTTHYMRDPLHAIRAHLTFCQAWVKKGEHSTVESQLRLNQCVQTVDRATRELEQLANDVVELQNLDRGEVLLNPEKLRLRTLIDPLPKFHTDAIDEKRDRVELRIEVDQPEAELWVDRKRLTQILNHYLSNAFKNTDAGWIEIATRTEPDQITFSVSDTGSGIIPRIAETIFRNNFVEDQQSETVGIGVGLYIVNHASRAMGGRVWFETEPDRGSSFYLSLPRKIRPEETGEGSPIVVVTEPA